MVVVFRAKMAMHLSPKDLGLSARVSGTVFRQSRLDCFGQFQDEFSDH